MIRSSFDKKVAAVSFGPILPMPGSVIMSQDNPDMKEQAEVRSVVHLQIMDPGLNSLANMTLSQEDLMKFIAMLTIVGRSMDDVSKVMDERYDKYKSKIAKMEMEAQGG